MGTIQSINNARIARRLAIADGAFAIDIDRVLFVLRRDWDYTFARIVFANFVTCRMAFFL